MQQATVNLFADMGVQPTTLMSGLTAATASTDATAPDVDDHVAGCGRQPDQRCPAVTISGTATDAGGGVVTGVEVSTDGGTTWHPVTTMSNPGTAVTWSYTWVAHGSPSATIKSRAVDDSGNLESPSARHDGQHELPLLDLGIRDVRQRPSIRVTLRRSRWGSSSRSTPSVLSPESASTRPVPTPERMSATSGPRTASCSRVRRLPVSPRRAGNRSTSRSPVSLNKNTTYIASYFAPNGHYSQNVSYFYATPPLGPAPHHHRCGQPAPARAPQFERRRQRCLLLLQHQHLPDQLLQCFELLGRPGLYNADLHHAARPGRQYQGDRRLRLGESDLVGSDNG